MAIQSLELQSEPEQEMSRRSGRRRIAQEPVATERRVADRRRVPGFTALFGDIVNGTPAEQAPLPQAKRPAAS